jgi:hypothetical protein
MTFILSSKGTVCDVAQSNQLDNAQGESQDMCGPWSVSSLKFAGLPGKGALASGAGHENPIDDWAEQEYTRYIGPNVISDQQGSSINNMHQFIHDAGNLHWWDITAITPDSVQSSDLAHIRAAIHAGYPVLITVNELSVHSKRLGKNPYPWEPGLGALSHVLPIVGIDSAGDFICADELNSFEPWPPIYLAAPIELHWASVVQLVGPDAAKPWLAPIPSGDPTTWPAGFNAQLFAIPPPPAVNYMAQQMPIVWNAFFRQLMAFATALNIPFPVAPILTPPPFDTAIAAAWRARYPKHQFGPAIGIEFDSINWRGEPLKVQYFLGGHAEQNVKTKEIIFYDGIGQKVI